MMKKIVFFLFFMGHIFSTHLGATAVKNTDNYVKTTFFLDNTTYQSGLLQNGNLNLTLQEINQIYNRGDWRDNLYIWKSDIRILTPEESQQIVVSDIAQTLNNFQAYSSQLNLDSTARVLIVAQNKNFLELVESHFWEGLVLILVRQSL